MQRALITGITGQDGSYLYEVHGVIRRASTFNTGRIDHIYVDPHTSNARLFLHYGDLSTSSRLTDLIYGIRPDEIYHLRAQSRADKEVTGGESTWRTHDDVLGDGFCFA